MTTDLTTWLETLTGATGHSLHRTVWSLDMPDGGEWALATDGVIAVMVRGPGKEKPDANQRRRLDHLLKLPMKQIGTSSAEVIRAWAGLYEPPRSPATKTCSHCQGSGRCECRCGDEHDCGQCDGEGDYIPDPEHIVRPGLVGTDPYDRNRIARAIEPLTGPCEVYIGGTVCEFRSPDWWVFVNQLDMTVTGDEPELVLEH